MLADTIKVKGADHPISRIQNCELAQFLEGRFSSLLSESAPLADLKRTLETKGLRYCVFGGWVRDQVSEALYGSPKARPRDIDLVVSDIEIGELNSMFLGDVTPTIFGGIHSSMAPIPFDIWPLHETFLLKHNSLTPSFSNLLRTTDFTINAGCFFPAHGQRNTEILDGGMVQAIKLRKLEFNASVLPFPTIQCARIAAYAVKLTLKLTPPVETFMREVLEKTAQRKAVVEGLKETYPADISVPAQKLLEQLTTRY